MERYYFLELHEQNGEYEHYPKMLFTVTGKQNASRTATRLASRQYGNGTKTTFGGAYSFHGGEVEVSVHRVSKIPFEEFLVLKKYLTVM